MAVLAIWMVQGADYTEMMQMAESDAAIFAPVSEIAEVKLFKCVPEKINGGRVDRWRGWAVILNGTWNERDVLSIVFHEEQSLAAGLSRLLARSDSSS